jgi:hypothetical protein
MERDRLELILPSFWKCYVMYGDFSYLTEDEQRQIDSCLAQYHNYYCVDMSQDEDFSYYNDCNSVGTNVSTYTFFKY